MGCARRVRPMAIGTMSCSATASFAPSRRRTNRRTRCNSIVIGWTGGKGWKGWRTLAGGGFTVLPIPPLPFFLPKKSAGGRTRTVGLALTRTPL